MVNIWNGSKIFPKQLLFNIHYIFEEPTIQKHDQIKTDVPSSSLWKIYQWKTMWAT